MFSLVPSHYEDFKLWQDSKIDRRPPKRRRRSRR
jgi:hypothetical protein